MIWVLPQPAGPVKNTERPCMTDSTTQRCSSFRLSETDCGSSIRVEFVVQFGLHLALLRYASTSALGSSPEERWFAEILLPAVGLLNDDEIFGAAMIRVFAFENLWGRLFGSYFDQSSSLSFLLIACCWWMFGRLRLVWWHEESHSDIAVVLRSIKTTNNKREKSEQKTNRRQQFSATRERDGGKHRNRIVQQIQRFISLFFST
jgi:hypothetical protein